MYKVGASQISQGGVRWGCDATATITYIQLQCKYE